MLANPDRADYLVVDAHHRGDLYSGDHTRCFRKQVGEEGEFTR